MYFSSSTLLRYRRRSELSSTTRMVRFLLGLLEAVPFWFSSSSCFAFSFFFSSSNSFRYLDTVVSSISPSTFSISLPSSLTFSLSPPLTRKLALSSNLSTLLSIFNISLEFFRAMTSISLLFRVIPCSVSRTCCSGPPIRVSGVRNL